MTLATIIMVLLALIMMGYAGLRRDGSLLRGLKQGWSTLRRTALLLLLAFIIVGFVNTLAPQDMVRQWIGPRSGLMGLAIGEIAGVLLPGGPYVVFPLIGALYDAGAGIGPILAMVVSWAMLAMISVSFELSFMGWRFSASRLVLGLPVPILIGLAAHLLFSG